MVKLTLLLCLMLPAVSARADRFYAYVGALAENSAILAWGAVGGEGNTIGRSSPSHGSAIVEVDSRKIEENTENWILIQDLKPNTKYPYRIYLKKELVAEGSFQTWAAKADKLAFFVIGDYGNGSEGQRKVAEAMVKEYLLRADTDNPIRFVLTTGDNIYGERSVFLRYHHTGSEDKDWREKFFQPYGSLLREVPFYPTLGNHDGNETEAHEDLATYLDNFFFPHGTPQRYYRFNYAGLAEFYALDSSNSKQASADKPIYLKGGIEEKWLQEAMAAPRITPWRIAYFHHPPFNAGPRHPADLVVLGHLVEELQRGGVQVVFNGHEHNFQFSERNSQTGGIEYVISGAGGELRKGDVHANMQSANIAGWSPQLHFLVVEIAGKTMRITPKSFEPVEVVNAKGEQIEMPLVVQLP